MVKDWLKVLCLCTDFQKTKVADLSIVIAKMSKTSKGGEGKGGSMKEVFEAGGWCKNPESLLYWPCAF